MFRGIFRSVNFPYTFRLNGKTVKAMKLYDSRLVIAEPWMSQLLERLLKLRKGVFIDVGANLGQTLCQVMTIDPTRRYFGFEPNPACNFYLQEIIRRNSFSNVTLVPVGLYTENRLLKLQFYNQNVTDAGASIVEDYWSYSGKSPVKEVVVPVMNFATVEKSFKIGAFDLVKIDVEGAELDVMLSMEQQVTKYRPFIIAEILSAYSTKNEVRLQRQQKIIEFTARNNYRIFRLIESKAGGIEYFMSIEEFDPKFDKNQCNYVFIPAESHSEFAQHFSDYLNV